MAGARAPCVPAAEDILLYTLQTEVKPRARDALQPGDCAKSLSGEGRGGEEMTPWNSVTCARAPATFRLAPVCKPTPRARSFCGRHTRVNNDDDELVCSLLPDGRAAKAAQTAQTAATADGGRGLRGQGRERHGNGAGPLGVVGRHPRARGALARSRQAAAQGGAPPQRALPAAPGAVTRGQGRGAGPPGPAEGCTPGRLADR